MEKRAKYAKLHPEMSNLDLTKILSKKYKELPEKKKVSSIYLESGEGYQECHNSISSFAYQQQAPFLLVLLAKPDKSKKGREREKEKSYFFSLGKLIPTNYASCAFCKNEYSLSQVLCECATFAKQK